MDIGRGSSQSGNGRRVVLVDMYWTRDKDPRVPLGHASLLAALARNAALDVRSLVVAVNEATASVDSLVDRLMNEAEGIGADQVDFAFGAYVWGEALLHKVLAAVRRRGFHGRIILGGPQVSYAGPGLEALYPEADVFVRGYGEDALSALTALPGRVEVLGAHWSGDVDRCQQAQVNLDALPSPWLTGVVPLTNQRFVRWESQRGCPYRCSFCQHREAGARLRRRRLESERVAAEIELFCRAGVEDIAVLDPIFNLGDHAIAVLEHFVACGYRGRLALQCRAECVEPRFLELAAQLNVKLEFGLQTIHAHEGRAIDRSNRIDRVDEVLAEVRRHGIDHEVSLIFGLPLQTLSSFMASVQWCLDREVPVIKAFPLMLLRGTALDRDRERWELRDSGGTMPMVTCSSSFDQSDWLAMARISESLSASERRHPKRVGQLLGGLDSSSLSSGRWQAPSVDSP